MEEDKNISPINVKLTLKGKSASVSLSPKISLEQLQNEVIGAFEDLTDAQTSVKLLYKGKVLGKGCAPTDVAFPPGIEEAKMPKIVVMASSADTIQSLNSRRSDPLMRGFDNEKEPGVASQSLYWGPQTEQHRHYKFVKLEACTWQSFGHRPNESTPHDFEALRLLEKLSTDPGVVAVMVERELVVNTLGEMDPVDDRIMKKKEQQGACLLGYNTNGGLRIDVKLRNDDLSGFLPYESIAATLIHELSHNWCGDHDALFWANYGQMRVEYLHRHAALAATGYIMNGRTTASLAGCSELCKGGLKAISHNVQKEVAKEMIQHGVPLAAVAPAIIQRCNELESEGVASDAEGRKLGGESGGTSTQQQVHRNTRELALAAAERRAKESKDNGRNSNMEE